ncbi:MAG: YihA family ribosome biogenesis GTP-binding protein [Gammaproteobacteria bacterium]|nr:YihA family ribosome biogenesis GTP-binding protein [Gammaproteobacteria bacterium]
MSHGGRINIVKNRFNKARFLLSAHTLAQLPVDRGVEVAFAGRSNVGKSSVINAIAGNRHLARTSKTPGRTQQLIFFELEPCVRMVDLPGYGYARVSAKMKQHWFVILNGYFEGRQSLSGLILIMDIRYPLTAFDKRILDWCQAADMRVHILLNKADKLSRQAGIKVLQTIRKQCAQGQITVQLFSAIKLVGLEEARQILDNWLKQG